jgi:hypothetical protein
MERLAEMAKSKGKHNVAFLTLFLLNKVEDCIKLLCETSRIPEVYSCVYSPEVYSPLVYSPVCKFSCGIFSRLFLLGIFSRGVVATFDTFSLPEASLSVWPLEGGFPQTPSALISTIDHPEGCPSL